MTTAERPAEHRPTSWVDVVAPVVLVLVVLTALEGSYSDRSYLVVGGLGAVMATALATVAWTQGRSRSELVLTLLVLFAPLGALVSRHEGDLVTVPGPDSMSAVLTGAVTGPGELLSTIPPADAAGAPLVLTFILGYVLAGSCAALALFSRRPVLPLLPVLFGLVLAILLGVQDPGLDGVRLLVLAATAVAWSSARGHRAGPTAVRNAGAVRSLVALVVAGGVAALLGTVIEPPAPSADDQRWVLRGQVGDGQDVSRLDNPLSRFRIFTRQLPGTPGNVFNETLLKVTGLPRDTPMRFVTLDVYDGTTWSPGNRTVEGRSDSLFLRIGQEVAAPLRGRPATVEVSVRRAYEGTSWLPLAGQLTSLEFTYLDGRAQREDVRYNPATLTAMVRGGLVRRDDYAFTAVLPRSELRVGMMPYRRGRSQPAGRFLDDALTPWRQASLTPMQRVFSVADYLRTNGRYSDGAESWEQRFTAGHDAARLGAGFFEADQMVGDHEQYAALLALAANRLGVPARVVVGAVPGDDGLVRGSDVTTWVEVRVADGSWRVLPAELYLSTRPPRRTDPPKQDPGAFVVAEEEAAEKEKGPRSQPPTAEPERETLPPTAEPQGSRVPGIVAGVLVALLLVGAVPAAKWWRRRRRRTSGSPAGRVAGAWQELLDLVVDLGQPVPAGAPRPTQAAVIGRGLDLARMADGVFAPVPPREDEVSSAWDLLAVERRDLLAQHGARGRLRAWWGPASLRGSVRTAVRRAFSAPQQDVVQAASPDREHAGELVGR
ncbi:hypothetical protein CFI00_11020 [Nocardioides sp. S5]|uniref:transglutaminase domain-containing protein n=1 Tax=Nocardioides sp. S5 TaxID=2017486 RepID=UPI001A8F2445|nr:transglutaminase domain-containing protein [Nocardioides sp. S5]QSR31017.1 hypothetical protein CFI00_11020 [Nocardioides sp. S5]